jgi:hypothetical protein
MDRDQFMAFRRCFHCVDVTNINNEQRKMMNQDDCFWIVDPFLSKLAERYQLFWQLDVNVNIDEGTIGFRGHHRARCFNPNKPHKYHFKAFCLNDSKTSYLYNFYMYRGKDESADPNLPATAAPIKRLMQHLKSHHVVHLDNWYTSMEALMWLVDNNFECIGTIKANRKFIPKDRIVKGTERTGDPRGFMTQSKTTYKQRDVYFISWKDKKPVNMLTTFLSYLEQCERRCKTNGIWGLKPFPQPSVIKMYNENMGGTDLFDLRLALYRVPFVAVKWALRLFDHFFMSTVLNAFFLYRDVKKPPKQYIYRTFVVNLMQQLVEDEHECPQQQCNISKMHTKTALQDSSRLFGYHSPRKINRKDKTRHRGQCRICTRWTTVFCETCNFYLCIESDTKQQTCFTKYHTSSSEGI